jgi:hypothetical protein
MQAQDFPGRTGKVFGRDIKSINPSNNTIRCVSSEYEESLQETDPTRQTESQFEEWLAPLIEETKQKMLTQRGANQIITIPVVVHVIHSGQAISNSGRNISDARVLSQITVLNQDFRRAFGTRGYNDNPIGADVEIEFCLAKIDPDGNSTTGINRVNLGNTTWSDTNVESILKPQTQWDPLRYFNIWVCQFGGDLNGVLGYAQFPSNSGLPGLSGGLADTDGVIIDWRCFGSNDFSGAGGSYMQGYNKGRTTTHEVGHALGLRHIWGDRGNQQYNIINCTGTDYCEDTPPAGWDNYDCAQAYDTCISDNYPDMTENYMDYTNDTCLNTFTLDQKARMITVMNNATRRRQLKTSTVCQPPLSNNSFELIQGLNLYPNPATNMVTLTISDNVLIPDNYTIFNSLGQTIASKQISNTQDLSINVSNLSVGVYFIKVTKDNNSKTLKFIKE